jgi:hypothetical protein
MAQEAEDGRCLGNRSKISEEKRSFGAAFFWECIRERGQHRKLANGVPGQLQMRIAFIQGGAVQHLLRNCS